MKVLITVILSCLVSSSLLIASTWKDPTWDALVKDSDLVGLFEIVDSPDFHFARARTIKLFKGDIPKEEEPILVTGFNDKYYSEEDIMWAAMKKGRQVYFCLIKGKPNADGEIFYYAPTPSCGTFRIEEGKVGYTTRETSYPWAKPLQTTRSLEELLTGIIENQKGRAPDPDVMAGNLKAMRGEMKRPIETSLLPEYLGRLRLMGLNKIHPEFKEILQSEVPAARFELARLLGGMPDQPEAEILLSSLLDDEHAIVQGEAVRQMTRNPSDEVAALLTGKLEASLSGQMGPTNIMSPVNNTRDGGRLAMIDALAEMNYKPAAGPMAALLQKVETEEEIYPIVAALSKMDADSIIKPLTAHLVRNTNSRVCEAINKAAAEFELKELKPAIESYLINHANSRWEVSYASQALASFGDGASGWPIQKKIAEFLEKENFDHDSRGAVFSMANDLGDLKHREAEDLVADCLFLFYGIDPIVANHSFILKLKEETEKKFQGLADAAMKGHPSPVTRVKTFVMNRRELAKDPGIAPDLNTVLHAEIHEDDGQEITREEANAIKAGLVKATGLPPDNVSFTSRVKNFGMTAQGADPRADLDYGQTEFLAYLDFVEACPRKENLEFLRYLVDSGIAKESGILRELEPVLKKQLVPK